MFHLSTIYKWYFTPQVQVGNRRKLRLDQHYTEARKILDLKFKRHLLEIML